jgi:hypothetical protein
VADSGDLYRTHYRANRRAELQFHSVITNSEAEKMERVLREKRQEKGGRVDSGCQA